MSKADEKSKKAKSNLKLIAGKVVGKMRKKGKKKKVITVEGSA